MLEVMSFCFDAGSYSRSSHALFAVYPSNTNFFHQNLVLVRVVLTCLGALGHQVNGAPMGRVSGVGAVGFCIPAPDFRLIFSRQIRRMETFVFVDDTKTNAACYLFSQ